MSVHIDRVELVWILVNAVAVAVTLWVLLDAVRDFRVVRIRNGAASPALNRARVLAAGHAVRRHAVRLLIQLLLLALVLPELLVDREVPLSPFVLTLVAVAVLMLINSLADWRESAQLARLSDEVILAERLAKMGSPGGVT